MAVVAANMQQLSQPDTDRQATWPDVATIAVLHLDAVAGAFATWCTEHHLLWQEMQVAPEHKVGFWSEENAPRAGDASWTAQNRDSFVAVWPKLLRFCEAGWFGSSMVQYAGYADFRSPFGATERELDAFSKRYETSFGAILGDADVHLVLPTNIGDIDSSFTAFVQKRIYEDRQPVAGSVHLCMPSGLVEYVSGFDVSLPDWFVRLVVALQPFLDSQAVQAANAWSLEDTGFRAVVRGARFSQNVQRLLRGMSKLRYS